MGTFVSTSLICAFLFSPAICQERVQQKPSTSESAPDLGAGKAIFQDHCALCHGLDGGGGRGPDLRRPKLNHAADDEALKSLIENGIPPDMPAGWYLGKQDIANTAAFVRTLGNVPKEVLPGNSDRGGTLYHREGCAACHILLGEGVGVGPDLTEIGAKRGAARLRETLRTPVRTIPEGFLLLDAMTPSGERIRGIRLNEDSFTIQIKDMQNWIYSFRKSELRELHKLYNETPMPSYERVFSADEIEDVVAFLASQRGRP
jgi:cytochrome c oxidase cbb3-type subunit 3